MLSISSSASNLSALSNDSVHDASEQALGFVDIELAPRASDSQSNEPRQAHPDGSVIDNIHEISTNAPANAQILTGAPQEDAVGSEAQPEQRDTGFFQQYRAFVKSFSDHMPASLMLKAGIAGGLVGEFVSGLIHTMIAACQDENRVSVPDASETICSVDKDLIVSVAEDPNTHLYAFLAAQLAIAGVAAFQLPSVIRSARESLSPAQPQESSEQSQGPEVHWSEAYDIESISKEQAQEKYQQELDRQEQLSGVSANSFNTMIQWTPFENIIDGDENIVFIEDKGQLQFCRESTLEAWIEQNEGHLFNPSQAHQSEYNEPKISIYRPGDC